MAPAEKPAGRTLEIVVIVLLAVTGVIGLFGSWWPGAVFALAVAAVLAIRLGVRRRP